MERIELLRKIFTDLELNTAFQRAHDGLQRELNDKDYRMASFYSFDIAHLYELMGKRKKAEEYYRYTLTYLNQADFKPHWIKLGSFYALGKLEEAVEAELSDRYPSKFWLAFFCEKMGNFESARQLYCELSAEKHWDPEKNGNYFYPHFLQEMSDFLVKAQNVQEAHRYTTMAVQAWEEMRDNIQKHLYPIEEAWLYEEVGYIYEKASSFEIAMGYYEKAGTKYEVAYTEEYLPSTETNQIDGDWDYYKEYFFKQLFPENLIIDLYVDSMNYDFRRIKYRLLNLEKQMKELSGIV
jgi:tetratricopeptide (TPR) repeat protein